MSSTLVTTSTSANFDAIFGAALAKYSKRTRKDLRNHPLASKIDACTSAESVLVIVRGQAKAFDDFRNGDPKLIKCLEPIINCLYALSTSPVLTNVVGLVCPTTSLRFFFNVLFNLVLVQVFSPASAIFAGISVILSVYIRPCYPRWLF
jgi:hypothetical protein